MLSVFPFNYGGITILNALMYQMMNNYGVPLQCMSMATIMDIGELLELRKCSGLILHTRMNTACFMLNNYEGNKCKYEINFGSFD